jgi:hypothetical protein
MSVINLGCCPPQSRNSNEENMLGAENAQLSQTKVLLLCLYIVHLLSKFHGDALLFYVQFHCTITSANFQGFLEMFQDIST